MLLVHVELLVLGTAVVVLLDVTGVIERDVLLLDSSGLDDDLRLLLDSLPIPLGELGGGRLGLLESGC